MLKAAEKLQSTSYDPMLDQPPQPQTLFPCFLQELAIANDGVPGIRCAEMSSIASTACQSNPP